MRVRAESPALLSAGNFDEFHPAPVRKRDMVCIGPVIELDRHSFRVNSQHRRQHALVAGPPVVVDNPAALLDLINGAVKFHNSTSFVIPVI